MSTLSKPRSHDSITLLGYADAESLYDYPDRVSRFAGLIDSLSDDATLICGAGDNTALGSVPLRTGGGRTVARPMFAAVEADADTFGNHDFDLTVDGALDWAESVPTQYLCANVIGLPESVPGGVVLERGGDRIGLIGVAHSETDTICGAIEDVRFTDPAKAVREAAAELPTHDHQVVLSHCGGKPTLATETSADVVLGGHVHDRWCRRIDGTLLVSPAAQGRELVEVTLRDNPEVQFHSVSAGPQKDELAEQYQQYRKRAGLDEIVATVSDPIPREEDHRVGGESRIGTFAAEAIRAAAEADVGLFPAGSVRAGPPLEGALTVGDVVSVAPFGDQIQELSISGEQLRDALADSAELDDGKDGWVRANLAGAHAKWNSNSTLETLHVNQNPVSNARRYTVATTGYLVQTPGFEPIGPAKVIDTHAEIHAALVEHARGGGLATAKRDGRLQKPPK